MRLAYPSSSAASAPTSPTQVLPTSAALLGQDKCVGVVPLAASLGYFCSNHLASLLNLAEQPGSRAGTAISTRSFTRQ